jgi:eukaryotic-like serine/threonine-protein kinase
VRESSILARWPQIHALPHQMPDFVLPEITRLIYPLLDKNPANRPTPAELSDQVAPIMAALPKPRLSGFKVGTH